MTDQERRLKEISLKNLEFLSSDIAWLIQTVRAQSQELAALRERAGKADADAKSYKELCETDFSIMKRKIETVEAERDRLAQENEKLVKQRDDARSGVKLTSPYDHVRPNRSDIEQNKIVEPLGEKLRSELEAWLAENHIVSVFMDTEEHTVRIDIAKLPPEITLVLRAWGSIYVKAQDGQALSAHPGADKAVEPTKTSDAS